jgi:hypothetical protein
MLKRTWVLIALAYLALAETLSWMPVPDLSLCLVQVEHSEQASNHDDKKYCPAFHTGAALIFERVDSFLEHHDKSVVGGFTIVLAISTIGLWLATNKLWAAGERQFELLAQTSAAQSRDMKESLRIAEKSADVSLASINLSEGTAERQLRAYITPAGAVIFAKDTDCRLHIKFVNSGQTPAYKFQCWYNFAVRPLVAPPFDNVGTPVGGSVIGAGDFNHIIRDFAITPAQKEAITDGLLGIFVWGRVTYEDAFRNSRFLHFRLIAVSFTRAIEFDSVKGYGWSLSIAGYHTDEYPQT